MLFKICLALLGLAITAHAHRHHGYGYGYRNRIPFNRARCIVKGSVTVDVTITQYRRVTRITGKVTGLTPGKHGFHIHQYGDLTDGCASTGGHYNPFKKNHGSLTSRVRHVGDMGNIWANKKGSATVRLSSSRKRGKSRILLDGRTSVFGRAIVVHAGQDDLGRVDNDGSRSTGNAGGRVACCIIGRADASKKH